MAAHLFKLRAHLPRLDFRDSRFRGQPLNLGGFQLQLPAGGASSALITTLDGSAERWRSAEGARELLVLPQQRLELRLLILPPQQLRPQADADEPQRLPSVARVLSGLGTRGVSTLLGR